MRCKGLFFSGYYERKIESKEGLYSQKDYDEKCLIINMLNCRPNFAEKYAAWAKGIDPANCTPAERMLLVWKGAPYVQNIHWDSMNKKSIYEVVDFYKNEEWNRNPKDVLRECNTAYRKEVVVDLWSLLSLAEGWVNWNI